MVSVSVSSFDFSSFSHMFPQSKRFPMTPQSTPLDGSYWWSPRCFGWSRLGWPRSPELSPSCAFNMVGFKESMVSVHTYIYNTCIYTYDCIWYRYKQIIIDNIQINKHINKYNIYIYIIIYIIKLKTHTHMYAYPFLMCVYVVSIQLVQLVQGFPPWGEASISEGSPPKGRCEAYE